MQLRKLFLLLGVLSLIVSRSVMALGLGEIKLNSNLNEPLDAHINLIDIGELGADQIIVRLADEGDFRRLGIDRSFFYTQLRFNVIADQPGEPFIAVTSKDAVREPFLSFVVEVRWTSGRLLREYTVLLDLPVFSDESARPIEATATPVSGTSTAVKNEPVRTAREPGAVPAERSTGSDVYGPVKANDTLWDIARAVRPGRASIQQTMLAIQRANPQAFIKGNINLLRKGQVLRIPSAQEIGSLTARQAISQVAQQNREWSGNAMGAQLDASGRSGSANRSDAGVQGQVKLAAPGTTGQGGTAQGGGYGSGSAGALADELAAAEEELQRSVSENNDLRSRVTDLEDQIETMERLLAVSNEQLAALQSSGEQESSMSTAEDTATAEQQSSVSTEVAVEPEVAEEPAPEVEESKPSATQVVRRPPEPSLMDKVMANIHWIGLAIVGLIVALFVILRKRSGASDTEHEFTSEFDDSVFETEEDTEQDAVADEFDEDLGDAFEEETVQPVEAETGDVVSEADIYIAYAKYDQAEEMLLKGLEKEVGSLPIQLKLLEVYAESGNRSAFDERYNLVAPAADQAALARANELRAQFGDAEPAADTTEEPALDELEDFGLDLDDDITGTEESDSELTLDGDDESESEPALDLDESFDLDDFAADSASNDSATEDLLDLDGEDLSLDDFELDLDEDSDGETAADPATNELELEGSETRYDLSFETDKDDQSDEHELLDFDLELDDESATGAADTETVEEPLLDLEADEPLSTQGSADEEFSLELDDTNEAQGDELSSDTDDILSLDMEDSVSEDSGLEPSVSSEPAELDDFELELDDDIESAPLLDEGLELDGNDSLESAEPESASSDTEELPDSSDDLTLDSAIDQPSESALTLESEDLEDDSDLTLDSEVSGASLDLADEDADDFDLDQAMGDLDLEALDREMADLDAPESDASVHEAAPAEPQPTANSEHDVSEDMDLSVDEDDAFDEALSGLDEGMDVDDLPTPESVAEVADDDDEDLDFLADADEVATKLDLARAYIDMGDMEGAKDILSEVTEEGNDEQKQEAQSLLEKVDS
ncbi:FimV/HubP family polar landmark protein [Gilvimarinus sp. SDUM040013]|uniref:FimV/HubP family polar landmark protein n=1 Tax=Gilvimarinus gilvus TaxID=3058038 RepID=A0ABU4S1H6_9GAMM|nr:FimV/HubP family polar landmark protein [Gilvimarinus sp. SDUM040013]MDO3386442.1 FimV/HubP family polar landmark protein [Gilvimarinus sp. SDUM040013]MDX6849708.1 FimV/HubP family polar landmark protein [Gilvimarinus sp. SDUM040013]